MDEKWIESLCRVLGGSLLSLEKLGHGFCTCSNSHSKYLVDIPLSSGSNSFFVLAI